MAPQFKGVGHRTVRYAYALSKLLLALSVSVSAVLAAPTVLASTSIAAAVLPVSRSVNVNDNATLFASVVNAGSETATSCRITNDPRLQGEFSYQTTDPATNAVVGSINTPVDIPVGGVQSFLISLSSTVAVAPTDIEFGFVCANSDPAPVFPGVNTLLFSASLTPVPDLIALGSTRSGAGTVVMPNPQSSNAFSVATINVGSESPLTVSAQASQTNLPLSIAMCQTNPVTGACLQSPSFNPLAYSAAAGATSTFSVFVSSTQEVPFDPANNRIFVRFQDAGGAVRGATSVAIRLRGANDPLAIGSDNAGALVDSSLSDISLVQALFDQTSAFIRLLPSNPVREDRCFGSDSMEVHQLFDVDGSSNLNSGDRVVSNFSSCGFGNLGIVATGSIETQIDELLVGSDGSGVIMSGRWSTPQPLIWNANGDTLTFDLAFRYVQQDPARSLTLGVAEGVNGNHLQVNRGSLSTQYRNFLVTRRSSDSGFNVDLSFTIVSQALRGTAQCDSTQLSGTPSFGGPGEGTTGLITCRSLDGTGLQLQTALDLIDLDTTGSGGFNNGSVGYSLDFNVAQQILNTPRRIGIDRTEFPTPLAPGALSLQLAVTTGSVSEANNRIYIANPAGLLIVDPQAGEVEQTISVPHAIASIAISDNGQVAYLGYADTGTIQLLDLTTNILGAEISLGIDSRGEPFEASTMLVVPGTTNQLVVVRTSSNFGLTENSIVLFVDGQAATTTFGPTRDNIVDTVFVSDSKLYASTFDGALELNISATDGVVVESERLVADLRSSHSNTLRSANGLLYSGSGTVLDPANNQLIGRYVPTDGFGSFDSIAFDPATSRAYLLDGEMLSVFDGERFLKLGQFEITEEPFSFFEFQSLDLLNGKLIARYDTNLYIVDVSQLPITAGATCQSLSLSDVRSTSAASYQSCAANDVVYHASSDRFIAALPSSAGLQGNSLAFIVPETGAIERTIALGSEPSGLAISANDDLIYVTFDERNSVTQVNLSDDSQLELVSFVSRSQRSFQPEFVDINLPVASLISSSPTDNATLILHFENRTTALFRDGVLFENPDMDFSSLSDLWFSSENSNRGFGVDGSNDLYLFDIDDIGISTAAVLRDLLSGSRTVFSDGFLYSTGLQKLDPASLSVVQNYARPETQFNPQPQRVFRLDDKLLGFYNTFDDGVFVATFNEETGEYLGERAIPGFGEFYDRGSSRDPEVTIASDQWVALSNSNGIMIIPQTELLSP